MRLNHCIHLDDFEIKQDKHPEELFVRVWCDPDDPKDLSEFYTPLPTIYWASEGEIIRNLMNSDFEISITNEFIFIGVWTFFMFVTYGTNVPSGLFLPGMIIGCGAG